MRIIKIIFRRNYRKIQKIRQNYLLFVLILLSIIKKGKYFKHVNKFVRHTSNLNIKNETQNADPFYL